MRAFGRILTAASIGILGLLRPRMSSAAVALAIAVLAGCQTGGEVPLVSLAAPTSTSLPTATPLAVEELPTTTSSTQKNTPEPKPTPTLKPAPTSKPASFYKPPGWDGSSDVDCPDFDTYAQAESFFKGTGGSTTNDPFRLDRDHDGKACESLP
jgi:hypothetical protein